MHGEVITVYLSAWISNYTHCIMCDEIIDLCHNFDGSLTHWGLLTPYGDRDLGQHWFRLWLVAWRHQAITWTNVDWSSVKPNGIRIRAIRQEMPQTSITKLCLKTTYLKFHSNFPGGNELIKLLLNLGHGWIITPDNSYVVTYPCHNLNEGIINRFF